VLGSRPLSLISAVLEKIRNGDRRVAVSEMPTPIRTSCVKYYTAALAGERSRFSFITYGHAYWVDAVPFYGDRGRVDIVLAIAIPAPPHTAAATAYEQTAARLESFADAAEQRAETHRHAGRVRCLIQAPGVCGRRRVRADWSGLPPTVLAPTGALCACTPTSPRLSPTSSNNAAPRSPPAFARVAPERAWLRGLRKPNLAGRGLCGNRVG
jgi:hypothetical protein